MRKCFLAALGIALAIGGAAMAPTSLTTVAQAAAPVNPQVAAILGQYPERRQLGLRLAIARLVEADAALAAAVVAASEFANPAQQAAIGAGLGDATNFFAKIGSDLAKHAAELIRAAIVYANPIVLANYTNSVSVYDAQVIPGTNNNAGNTTSNCISPSRPGHGC